MKKTRIAVLYGSRSPEHEVSIITALQVMQNLDPDKYEVIPLYISKTGSWLLGDKSLLQPETYKNLEQISDTRPKILLDSPQKLQQISKFSLTKTLPAIDIFFPVFHGTYGEDGTIQGLLETMNVPYVGCGVLASALGMDKLSQKQIFSTLGLPQVPFVWFYRSDWKNDPAQVRKSLISLRYPLFVKPANGGSSIGISKVGTASELTDAIDVACAYDRKIIIEQSAEKFTEVNISVLGNSGSELRTSVCEQLVNQHGILTYKDKYESASGKTTGNAGMASAQRLIPAHIKLATAQKISAIAKNAFSGLDCSGLSRIDFLVSSDEKTIFINEINTIPGSLAFYLWEKSGLTFPKLLDELVKLGLERYHDRSQTTFTFSTNILANLGRTLKGAKIQS